MWVTRTSIVLADVNTWTMRGELTLRGVGSPGWNCSSPEYVEGSRRPAGTIGALQAGTKENVMPDEALIKVNVRTSNEGALQRFLAATRASSTPRQPPRARPSRLSSR